MITQNNAKMSEDFIYYLWRFCLSIKTLESVNGEKITVISPGTKNTDSGPDIFNAMILIDNTRWAGNIEFHINSSDWFKHGHHNDKAYDSTILHVVYKADKQVFRSNGSLIPTIEIADKYNPDMFQKYQVFQSSSTWIPCSGMLNQINYFDKILWFERLMAERLEHKALDIFGHLSINKNDLTQVLFQKLSRGFGYKVNADAMEQLASSIKYRVLLKHSNNLFQLEALLYGQAGLLSTLQGEYCSKLFYEYTFLKQKYGLIPMNPESWKFMRMRPANFPTIRISQLANLIYKTSGQLINILDLKQINDISDLLNVSASEYWNNHYRFGKLVSGNKKKTGKTMLNRILINVIIPAIFVYGRMKNTNNSGDTALLWLSQIPPEKNNITKSFEDEGLSAENAGHSQALIELFERYCSKKRCLYCRFGHIIIN